MGLWNYCKACKKRIETGEPCIGVKEYSEPLCGDSICLDCAKIENLPDGKDPVSITDLLARAEAAEAQLKEATRCVAELSMLIKAVDGKRVMETVLPMARKRLEKYYEKYPPEKISLQC